MNSKTMFYILKRALLALLTVWVVITITFFVMHSVPGGPFVGEKAISKEAQAALEAKNEHLTDKNTRLEERLEEVKAEGREIVAENKKLKDDNQRLKEDNDTLKKSNGDLSAEKLRLQMQIQELRNKKAAAERAAAQAKADSDTAVIVIGRASGEDRENQLDEGSFYLTEEENAMLAAVTHHFPDAVLVLNIGSIMDFSFLEEFLHLHKFLLCAIQDRHQQEDIVL